IGDACGWHRPRVAATSAPDFRGRATPHTTTAPSPGGLGAVVGEGRAGARRPARATLGSDHCSTGCGSSRFSCAVIVGWSASEVTSILRGLAFSLTGIVTLSTPLV